MKYVKTYENFNIHTFYTRLRKIIDKIIKDREFLSTRSDKEGFVIQEKDPRRNKGWDSNQKFFQAEFFHLKDKKLRDIPLYDREKIGLTFKYGTFVVKKDKEFCEDLSQFLTSVFKKYSYYTRTDSLLFKTELHTFYIKTSDIENILNETENKFHIYVDMKKYNL